MWIAVPDGHSGDGSASRTAIHPASGARLATAINTVLRVRVASAKTEGREARDMLTPAHAHFMAFG